MQQKSCQNRKRDGRMIDDSGREFTKLKDE